MNVPSVRGKRSPSGRRSWILAFLLAIGIGSLTAAAGTGGTPAKDPAPTIKRILGQGTEAGAYWGVSVLDLKSGRTIVAINDRRLFVPASILKLFTGYAALVTFGREYRFTTDILSTGRPDSSGVLRGPLIIRGGGDPSWSFRFFDDDFDKPIQAFVDLLLGQTGLRRVEGDIIADDTRFLDEPYGPDWNWENFQWAYGAKVSALPVNENVMLLQIQPRGEGNPVEFQTVPDFFRDAVRAELNCRSQASLEDLIAFKPLDMDRYFLKGSIPPLAEPARLRLTVSDPALVFGRWLRQELGRRGVTVTGDVRVRHRAPYFDLLPLPGTPIALASIPGRPLAEIVEPMMKRSINLYAELLLRNMGVRTATSDQPERNAGIDHLYSLWHDDLQAGRNIQLFDGSGLSPRNLVTPQAVTQLLKRIYFSADVDLFRDLLPVSGEDGTLKYRLGGKTRERVFAKTGQLGHVASMAGFMQTRNSRWLAFCIIANNHPLHKTVAKSTIDQIMKILYQ